VPCGSSTPAIGQWRCKRSRPMASAAGARQPGARSGYRPLGPDCPQRCVCRSTSIQRRPSAGVRGSPSHPAWASQLAKGPACSAGSCPLGSLAGGGRDGAGALPSPPPFSRQQRIAASMRDAPQLAAVGLRGATISGSGGPSGGWPSARGLPSGAPGRGQPSRGPRPDRGARPDRGWCSEGTWKGARSRSAGRSPGPARCSAGSSVP